MTFELTVLGTSSAVPTSVRFPSAHVLNAYEQFFLIDCGEGTQIQLRKFKIKFSRINHIFISHLHGDHYLGLYGLLSSFSLQNRTEALHIYGPADLKKLVRSQLKYLDIGYPIFFHFLNFEKKTLILSTKNLMVYSFPLMHSIPTCGFLFEEQKRERNVLKHKIVEYDLGLREIVQLKAGNDVIREDGTILKCKEITAEPNKPRSYAYCSDTMYFEDLAKYVQNVDILYHESTFMESDRLLANQTMHSTAVDAAKTALNAKASKLLIGHYSGRYFDLDPLFNEAKSLFHRTILGFEGLQISLPFK